MDLIQKAKEAIMKAEHTSNVVVVSLSYDISMSYGGIREVKTRVWLGKRMKTTREYTMYWDAEKEEFVNLNPKPDLISSFKREYNDFKISSMTEEELFALLRKANRRRKSAEQKLRLKQAKCRRISDDAMTAIGSRCRMIEEQWEVMKELQRRGLVTTEALEQVIFDVTGMKPLNLKIEKPVSSSDLTKTE